MNVLVTGSTGFLGRHLVSALLGKGMRVTALVRRPEPELEARGVSVALGDVLDRASVERAASGCEAVFHCAGKVSRRREDAGELRKVHVEGTKIVLDAAQTAGVRRAVVASTSGVVAVSGDPDEVRDESAPTPTDILARFPYYLSKLYAEEAALERSAPEFDVIAVCPALLLGPGDVHGSSTSDVVDLLERRIPFVPAGGISIVDARDAAEAMILALEKGKAGARYLVHSQNLTLRAFAERIARVSGVEAPSFGLPRSPLLARLGAEAADRLKVKLPAIPALDPVTAEMAQYYWYVDSTRARTELGFSPRDPMDTIADTVDDLKARGVAWPRA
jgi:dihydroflavonol-4-reductase